MRNNYVMRNASTDKWDNNNDDWNGENSGTSATNLINEKQLSNEKCFHWRMRR